VYLSNTEKEALWLTGYGDVPPWAAKQGLEQALARGSYIPGEEALRMRLADALDLEERLADQRAEEAAAAANQGAAEESSAGQWRSPLEMVSEGATDPAQDAPGHAPGEEEAPPAAVDRPIKDRDFSSFTKAQLLAFAATFGVQLKRTDSKDELVVQVQRLVDESSG